MVKLVIAFVKINYEYILRLNNTEYTLFTLDCHTLLFDVELRHHKSSCKMYIQTMIPSYHELMVNHCLHRNLEYTTAHTMKINVS